MENGGNSNPQRAGATTSGKIWNTYKLNRISCFIRVSCMWKLFYRFLICYFDQITFDKRYIFLNNLQRHTARVIFF